MLRDILEHIADHPVNRIKMAKLHHPEQQQRRQYFELIVTDFSGWWTAGKTFASTRSIRSIDSRTAPVAVSSVQQTAIACSELRM